MQHNIYGSACIKRFFNFKPEDDTDLPVFTRELVPSTKQMGPTFKQRGHFARWFWVTSLQ